MAKKKRALEPAELTRKQVAVSRRERAAQRYVLVFVGVVALAVIFVLAFGLWHSGILAPNLTAVAVVNGEKIAVQDFRKRVRLSYHFAIQDASASQGVSPDQAQQTVDLESVGEDALDNMITEVLVRQTAAEMGITVSEAEVEDRIRQYLGFPTLGESTLLSTPFPTSLPTTPTPTSTFVYTLTPSPTIEGASGEPVQATPTPTTTATGTPGEATGGASQPVASATPTVTRQPPTDEEEAAFRQAYEEQLAEWNEASGMTEADIRELFAYSVIVDKLFDEVDLDVPTTTEQALVAHILVATPDEAEALLARLEEGESFAELAAENSLDSLSAYRGGELGWGSREQYALFTSPEFADLVFSQPIGEPGGPVQTAQGYHLVLVYDRQEVPLTPAALEQRRWDEFQSYLTLLRVQAEGNIEIDEDWQRFLSVLD